MRIPMAELLKKAQEGGYGCPAPNVFSWNQVESCFRLSEKHKAPLVIDMAPIAPLMEPIAEAVKYYDRKYPNALVTLNLDHGLCYDDCMMALRYGFDSVMIDASGQPFEENIRQTAEVAKVAHAMGASVEAELGHVGYTSGHAVFAAEESKYTNPGEAQEFVSRSGVDCLAVSIGTCHGVYAGGTPHLNFELLQTLRKDLSIPLVLHGGSSTGDENLRKAVELGIQKVNLCSDLENRGYEVLEKAIEGISGHLPSSMEIFGALTEGYEQMLEHFLLLFGGIGALG